MKTIQTSLLLSIISLRIASCQQPCSNSTAICGDGESTNSPSPTPSPVRSVPTSTPLVEGSPTPAPASTSATDVPSMEPSRPPATRAPTKMPATTRAPTKRPVSLAPVPFPATASPIIVAPTFPSSAPTLATSAPTGFSTTAPSSGAPAVSRTAVPTTIGFSTTAPSNGASSPSTSPSATVPADTSAPVLEFVPTPGFMPTGAPTGNTNGGFAPTSGVVPTAPAPATTAPTSSFPTRGGETDAIPVTDNDSSQDAGFPIGVAVGIAIGAVALAVVAGFLWKKRKQPSSESSDQKPPYEIVLPSTVGGSGISTLGRTTLQETSSASPTETPRAERHNAAAARPVLTQQVLRAPPPYLPHQKDQCRSVAEEPQPYVPRSASNPQPKVTSLVAQQMPARQPSFHGGHQQRKGVSDDDIPIVAAEVVSIQEQPARTRAMESGSGSSNSFPQFSDDDGDDIEGFPQGCSF